jgi:uncharacterized protein YecE (DUF72 family)
MLLYPSAGQEDWKNILDIFMNRTDKFIFADLNYSYKDIQQFKSYLESLGKTTILSHLQIPQSQVANSTL